MSIQDNEKNKRLAIHGAYQREKGITMSEKHDLARSIDADAMGDDKDYAAPSAERLLFAHRFDYEGYYGKCSCGWINDASTGPVNAWDRWVEHIASLKGIALQSVPSELEQYSEREEEAIAEMMKILDVSRKVILRGALAHYQLHVKGYPQFLPKLAQETASAPQPSLRERIEALRALLTTAMQYVRSENEWRADEYAAFDEFKQEVLAELAKERE